MGQAQSDRREKDYQIRMGTWVEPPKPESVRKPETEDAREFRLRMESLLDYVRKRSAQLEESRRQWEIEKEMENDVREKSSGPATTKGSYADQLKPSKLPADRSQAVLALVLRAGASIPPISKGSDSAMTEDQQTLLLRYAEIIGQKDLAKAAQLLRAHSWNVERAVAKFFDGENDDQDTEMTDVIPVEKGDLPERTQRLRKFLRFCIAVFYGLDQESGDKLSKDEWHHFVSLSATMFDIQSSGRGSYWERNEAYMEPIVHNINEPGRELGMHVPLFARRVLQWFGYLMICYPKTYQSLDCEVEEQRGWIISAEDLGMMLSWLDPRNKHSVVKLLFPTEFMCRHRIFSAHRKVVRKYFSVWEQHGMVQELSEFGKTCNLGKINICSLKCWQGGPLMCKCNAARKADQAQRFDDLRELAALLRLEEFEVREQDMFKWRIAKQKEEELYVIPGKEPKYLGAGLYVPPHKRQKEAADQSSDRVEDEPVWMQYW